MSLFGLSPDKLLAAMGIDPAQAQKAVADAVGFAQAARAEMDAMKAGFGQAVLHFNSELAAMRAALVRIETAMQSNSAGNGAAPHVESESNG